MTELYFCYIQFTWKMWEGEIWYDLFVETLANIIERKKREASVN
jgi:hypothetical protein